MPYLLLILGLLIGLYALYRFFLNANVNQIKALGLTAVFVVLCLALFYLAITGRLPAAIALLAALSPVILGFWKAKKGVSSNTSSDEGEKRTSANEPMTRTEALEILGLEDGVNEKEIKDAYKTLMRKVHPDQEGSEWLATKLNQAKDLLLKE